MTELYSENDLIASKKQRKNLLTVYFVVLAVYLLVTVTLLVYYTQQDYNTPKKTPLLVTNCVLSAIFVVFSFIFLIIKFKRVNSYCKFLYNVFNIKATEGNHVFVRHDRNVSVKDKVDFTTLVFLEWSEKEHEFYETGIYIDCEKPVPKFKKGDKIYHKTIANVLTAYEVRNDDIFE